MQLGRLDHINLRTNQLAKMIDWYSTTLGMKTGPRPNFPFPGAWMYAGDHPIVHLVEVEGNPGTGSEVSLSRREDLTSSGLAA